MQTQACHLYANFARKNRQNLIGQRQYTCWDCYPNLIDIENPLDKNETDQDIVQEQIQE